MGADFAPDGQNNQRRLYQQNRLPVPAANRPFPCFEVSACRVKPGRQVRLAAQSPQCHRTPIRERWRVASWDFIELVVSSGLRDGKPLFTRPLVITTLRTSQKAMLRTGASSRWAIENQLALAPRHPARVRTLTALRPAQRCFRLLASACGPWLQLVRCNVFRSSARPDGRWAAWTSAACSAPARRMNGLSVGPHPSWARFDQAVATVEGRSPGPEQNSTSW